MSVDALADAIRAATPPGLQWRKPMPTETAPHNLQRRSDGGVGRRPSRRRPRRPRALHLVPQAREHRPA